MEKLTGTYLSAEYINYSGTLKRFKQSENQLQPIFEAFTNSLETIEILKERHSVNYKGEIVHFTPKLLNTQQFLIELLVEIRYIY